MENVVDTRQRSVAQKCPICRCEPTEPLHYLYRVQTSNIENNGSYAEVRVLVDTVVRQTRESTDDPQLMAVLAFTALIQREMWRRGNFDDYVITAVSELMSEETDQTRLACLTMLQAMYRLRRST